MQRLHQILDSKVTRFLLTGALNTLFGYAVYALSYWVCNNKSYALTATYIIGILFNFKSYSVLVFKSHDNTKIFLFVLIYVVVFGINYASLFIYNDIIGINAYLSQLIVLLYVPAILFFLLRDFVFAETDSPA